MKEFRRILVVRTDRIGDVILTLPMLEVLRKNFPQAHIAILIRQYTRELLEGNNNIDEILFYDDGNTLFPFFRMAATLRKGRFDVAFVTYPRLRLAWLIWCAGIPLRVGTGYRWYSLLFNKRVFVHRRFADRHEAEYNLDLLKAVDGEVQNVPIPHIDVLPRLTSEVRKRLSEFGISSDKTLIILHPGSGGSARNWSSEKFGALGRKLLQLPDVQVIVTGGKGEETLVQSVADMISANTPVIVNQLSLQGYAALAKLASLLVANSTGPLHIAAAVETPVIGLYSQVTSMSPTRWGPYTDRKTVFVPQGKPVDCRACVRADKRFECECMNAIRVEEVFEAARHHLASEQLSMTR